MKRLLWSCRARLSINRKQEEEEAIDHWLAISTISGGNLINSAAELTENDSPK